MEGRITWQMHCLEVDVGIDKAYQRKIDNLSPYQRLRAKLAYERAVEFGDPDPIGFVAQLYRESRFDPNAHSSAGAHGEGQFMPATAARFGLNPSDPDASQYAALKYRAAIRKYLGKKGVTGEDYVLSGYNAGEGNAVKARTKFRETIGYVNAINASRPLFAKMLSLPENAVPAEAAANPIPQQPAPTLPYKSMEATAPPLMQVSSSTLSDERLNVSATPVKDYTDSLWRTLLGR